MAPTPNLRVVPLESIRRHEEIDPLRVESLSGRIDEDGIQANPMVCVAAPSGELVLLDGATRTESLKKIGLSHAVVQLVDPAFITLGTWHHVVRGCRPDELIDAVGSGFDLITDEGTPALHPREAVSSLVVANELSANATLSGLVERYMGRWPVTRTTDPRREHVMSRFDDWAAIVEFPTLSLEDVMAAAISNDLLPAGITRFKVPDRALRLNMPLSILRSEEDIEGKQRYLDTELEQRARDGRIRRYEEPVFILDD